MKELIEKVYKTAAFYQAKALRVLRGHWFDWTKPRLNRPIFVVGCSRAGTTLVYKTLSESAHLGSLHKETHDFWASLHPLEERGFDSHVIPPEAACEADRKAVSRLFYSHTGKLRFVDKNNQNGLSIPYLHALFPDAYFVYVKRNPGDNIHSLIEGWKKPEVFGLWAKDLPAQVNIEEGKFRRWCFFLPPGWRKYLNASIEEVCALQYRAMNAAILKAKALVKNRWCEVFYEDILVEPVGSFTKVFAAVDVPFDDSLRRHCQVVLQNPYNAFSRVGIDKWKASPNREKIERILPHVEEVAREMGYGQS
ncbi:MAG: sulfotransferase [Methylohalobius sp.]|nr:sulfotransferase [Methylohalobius sp.]